MYNTSMDKKNNCENAGECLVDIEYFKVLFDPVRIDIIEYLSVHGPKNIGEITENFTQDRSVISRHLDMLYKKNILKKKKESRFIIYDLNTENLIFNFEKATEQLKLLLKAKQ